MSKIYHKSQANGARSIKIVQSSDELTKKVGLSAHITIDEYWEPCDPDFESPEIHHASFYLNIESIDEIIAALKVVKKRMEDEKNNGAHGQSSCD